MESVRFRQLTLGLGYYNNALRQVASLYKKVIFLHASKTCRVAIKSDRHLTAIS